MEGVSMGSSKKSSLAGVAMALVLAVASGAFTLRSNEISAEQKGGTMTVVRLYTGPDNKSHFEDIQIPLKDGGKVGFISELQKATGVVFRETTGDYDYDFHPAPRRQYVVNLEGEVEIEVGDGTRRILRTGDILLAEDTTGQGHISRAVAGKPRKSLFITLD
jgi:opacity protein-like surface antigen